MKKRTGTGRKPKRTVKRRSSAAAALAEPRYRKRVVKSAKAYSRKRKGPLREEAVEADS